MSDTTKTIDQETFETLRLSESARGLAADVRGASFRIDGEDGAYARRRADDACFKVVGDNLTTHDRLMRAIHA
jgi:hypothetical protein